MSVPVGLVAQTGLPAATVLAQVIAYDPHGQTQFGYAWGAAPANGLLFSRESLGLYHDNVFSVNQPRGGDEALSSSPSMALLETSECQEISFNHSPSSLLCPTVNQINRLNQEFDLGPSYRSGTAFWSGLRDSHRYQLGGVQPIPGEGIGSGPGLATDLDSKDYTSPAMTRVEAPGLDDLHSHSEKHDDMAFQQLAPSSRSGGNSVRGKVALVILGLAVHAAVTWDAQSTNHFFHHYPEGYRPTEVDPLMRPFAGKALMYPMANLLFAAPVDLLLFETRHRQKPIQILTYAAASFWVGMEIHQSIVNIGNEHISGSR